MTSREPRWWFVVYAALLGGLVAAAAVIGDRTEIAIVALIVMPAWGVAMAFTPWGTLRPGSQDEREQSIGRDAAVVSYYTLLAVILGTWLWALATGADTEPWSLLGLVSGASYAAALAYYARRR